jgi:hypothetical protein
MAPHRQSTDHTFTHEVSIVKLIFFDEIALISFEIFVG